jgi:hypothetical protein
VLHQEVDGHFEKYNIRHLATKVEQYSFLRCHSLQIFLIYFLNVKSHDRKAYPEDCQCWQLAETKTINKKYFKIVFRTSMYA